MLLIAFSNGGGNAGAGVVVEILDPSVQAQKFLDPFPPLESKLLPHLTLCGPVGLLNPVIAAGRPDYLLILHSIEAG
ncbi:hypothetical protein GCM10010840_36580 [Deinococcus aerolatus]|uniref:Uncharacterized protein n=1 Tax=Deinococcus aerolatus TaxID=522487 RepID=A0ABQ2GGD2_9DEIO|nr:hypothetical protein GCM10010840_36580 [Deinococcus aerolatus]